MSRQGHNAGRQPATLGLTLTLLLAAAFVGVLQNVLAKVGVEGWDAPATRFVANHRSPGLISFAKVIALLGSPGFTIALAVVVVVVLGWSGMRPAAAFLAAVVGVGQISYFILKRVVRRPRPVGALLHIASFSFPSGHAVGAVVLYAGLALILNRLLPSRPARAGIWVVAAVLILLIGASRVVLGVHYLSDVIAGYLLGAFWLATAWTALVFYQRANRT